MATLTPVGAVLGTLHQGGPNKADLLLVDAGDGPFVLKDFGKKRGWTRLLGRLQVSREAKAYRWLDGVQGVPRLVGRPSPHALAMEYVEGVRLADDSGANAAETLAELRGLLDRIHERGVVHNDLRSRENLLRAASGRLYVVDFAGALRLRPGSWAHRILFPVLVQTDEAAYLRWKERLDVASLDPAERDFLARFARRRSLWPFNRKRKRKP